MSESRQGSFSSKIFLKEGTLSENFDLSGLLPKSFWSEYEEIQDGLPTPYIKSSKKTESYNIKKLDNKGNLIDLQDLSAIRKSHNIKFLGYSEGELKSLVMPRNHYSTGNFSITDLKDLQKKTALLFTRSVILDKSKVLDNCQNVPLIKSEKCGEEIKEKEEQHMDLISLLEGKREQYKQYEDEKNHRRNKMKAVCYTSRFYSTLKQT
jgi:hypothetical protein